MQLPAVEGLLSGVMGSGSFELNVSGLRSDSSLLDPVVGRCFGVMGAEPEPSPGAATPHFCVCKLEGRNK